MRPFLSKSVNFFSFDSFLSSLKKRLSYLFSYYFYKIIIFPNVISINTERGRYFVSVRGIAPASSVRGIAPVLSVRGSAPIGNASFRKSFWFRFFQKAEKHGMLAFFFPQCAFFLGDSKKKGQLVSGTIGAQCNGAFARGQGVEFNFAFASVYFALLFVFTLSLLHPYGWSV